jgi:hypothetical protein
LGVTNPLDEYNLWLVSVEDVKSVVGPNAIIRKRSRTIYLLLAATVLLTALASVKGQGVQADSQTQAHRQCSSSEAIVIQGRVTKIVDALVSVKTPDGYPGEGGGHPLFVVAGPTFSVDITGARLLLPDGKRVDRRSLVVGDRVLMVLSGSDSGSPQSSSLTQTYFACIVERIVQSDKVTTH